MITAVDTNILLDVLLPNPAFEQSSLQALTESSRVGAVVVSEAVYAELAVQFSDRTDLEQFIKQTGIRLEASSTDTLYQAGRAWRTYRQRDQLTCPQCGQQQRVTCSRCGRTLTTRQHVVADFLIGAHALQQATRLLTRDRGYYAAYFPGLVLVP